ncbi:hypothetical protein RN001_004968 [Aquatica leii]|uniref:Uncharacterized protein n=1 Tax=Aquatica leii TaxID=1421715 RepID=A0AAN7PC12_9COLE|nr:hypothetical protein RN001_004968 [Aquatica leii]
MKSFQVVYLWTLAITFVTTSPISEDKTSKAETGKDVPKGKKLIFAEPLYNDYDLELIPEYDEPIINYDNADPEDFGQHDVIKRSIVFRPLFAYRKQMEQRRRIYLQQKIDRRAEIPKRRGYYYYYRYPMYYQNSPVKYVF